jgi:hypothetical protein
MPVVKLAPWPQRHRHGAVEWPCEAHDRRDALGTFIGARCRHFKLEARLIQHRDVSEDGEVIRRGGAEGRLSGIGPLWPAIGDGIEAAFEDFAVFRSHGSKAIAHEEVIELRFSGGPGHGIDPVGLAQDEGLQTGRVHAAVGEDPVRQEQASGEVASRQKRRRQRRTIRKWRPRRLHGGSIGPVRDRLRHPVGFIEIATHQQRPGTIGPAEGGQSFAEAEQFEGTAERIGIAAARFEMDTDHGGVVRGV